MAKGTELPCQGTGYTVHTRCEAILGERGKQQGPRHSLNEGAHMDEATRRWLTPGICLPELVFFKCGAAEASGEEATCRE